MKIIKKYTFLVFLIVIFSFILPLEIKAQLQEFFNFNFAEYTDGELNGQNSWVCDTGVYSIENTNTNVYNKNVYMNWMSSGFKNCTLDLPGGSQTGGTESVDFYVQVKSGTGLTVYSLYNETDTVTIMYLNFEHQSGTTWRFENSAGSNIFGTNTVQENDWIHLTYTIDWDTPSAIIEGYNETTSTYMGSYTYSSYAPYLTGVGKLFINHVNAQSYLEGFAGADIVWDDSDRYDYVDEIKNIRMLWHDYSEGNGSIFGLGIDIQNELLSWDSLIIEIDTLSIQATFDLTDITSGLIKAPSIIFRSDDYQAYWPDGEYTFEFYLSKDGTPELDTQMTLTLGIPKILSTESQYTSDFLEYDFGELNEDGSYGENPYDSKMGGEWWKIKQKFPLSWIVEVKDIWTSTKDEITTWDSASDGLSIVWTLPSGLQADAWDGQEFTFVDMTTAKSNYSGVFSTIRTIISYTIYISLIFHIWNKGKGLLSVMANS